nr:hypothetical protein [Tanacetum cinerariifolium]
MQSVISRWMVARVMAGILDVDVLLGDPTGKDGDTEVSVSLGEISSKGKKSWESDIGDCDNTKDGDPTDEDGDIEDSVYLGEISSKEQKSWESDIGDCDNTRDGGKTVRRAIITWGGEITLYACMASIYGSLCKGEKISMSKRPLRILLEQSIAAIKGYRGGSGG